MKAAIKIVQGVFLVLCLGYLAYALFNESESIFSLFRNADKIFLLPALLFWPCGVLISAWFASQVIETTGRAIHYRDVLAIYLNRIPARYLPGGIWQTFARAYDLNNLGLEKGRIATLVFYENFWTVLLAALVSSIALVIGNRSGVFGDVALLMMLGTVAVFPMAYFFRKTPFVLSMKGYIRITVSGLLFWSVAGSSFIFYLMAFDSALSDQSLPVLFANYLFSYVIGFISIFTPQGIGVFELVMTQLTEFSIDQSQALILIAGFRIIVLVGDMIAWSLFVVISKSGGFTAKGSNAEKIEDTINRATKHTTKHESDLPEAGPE